MAWLLWTIFLWLLIDLFFIVVNVIVVPVLIFICVLIMAIVFPLLMMICDSLKDWFNGLRRRRYCAE